MTEIDRIREYVGSARWRPTAGREYLVRERTAGLHQIVAGLGRPLSELSICDVGCGVGTDLVAWRHAGVPEAQLAGTELMPERAIAAHEKLAAADIRTVEGFDLPFASRGFDVSTASLVLSTIRSQSLRQSLLREMARVTKPGGVVMVYDFAIRKPWNGNVAAVSSRELRRLWRSADAVHRAAPLLPGLEIALRLPAPACDRLIAMLPRTHRLWTWHIEATPTQDEDRAR